MQPVFFLNARKKEKNEPKPLSKATDVIEVSVFIRSSFAFSILIPLRYSGKEVQIKLEELRKIFLSFIQ